MSTIDASRPVNPTSSADRTLSAKQTPELALRHGFRFPDLYDRDGLVRLDGVFLEHLRERSPDLHGRLVAARHDPAAVPGKAESELIIAVAPYLEDFVGELFGIERELRAHQAKHAVLAPLFTAKRRFVQKRVNAFTPEQLAAIDPVAVAAEFEAITQNPLTEQSYAEHFSRWL